MRIVPSDFRYLDDFGGIPNTQISKYSQEPAFLNVQSQIFTLKGNLFIGDDLNVEADFGDFKVLLLDQTIDLTYSSIYTCKSFNCVNSIINRNSFCTKG